MIHHVVPAAIFGTYSFAWRGKSGTCGPTWLVRSEGIATRNKCIATRSKGLTSSNKKLLVASCS